MLIRIFRACLIWCIIYGKFNNLWAQSARDGVKDNYPIKDESSKAIDNTDWQPLPFCNKNDQNPKSNILCCGCYVEPEYPLAITITHPPDTLIINADRTKIISKGLSNFDGNVVVAKNNQQITSIHAKVKQNNKGEVEYITAEEKVKIIQPGLRFFGQSAKFVPKNNYKIIYRCNYRLYAKHATGDADRIEIFDDNLVAMSNATYTTCKPGDDTWLLTADTVKLDKNTGRGEAWNAKLHIKSLPVFYSPYINFSIDKRRQTGFLIPVLSSTSKHGLGFVMPWYWNMAPNYDYTLSPSYFSKRGYKFDNLLRYLTDNSSGSLGFNFLPRDRHNLNFVKTKLINPGILTTDLRYRNLKERYSRYSIWFNNKTTIKDSWQIYVNYNKTSDDNYLQDFGQDIGQKNISSNSNFNLGSNLEEAAHNSDLHLNQSVILENTNKYGVLNFNLSQYQTLHPFNGPIATEQYKKFPEIAWRANYLYLPYSFRSQYNVSYTDFKLKNIKDINNLSDLDVNVVVGKRIHGRYGLEKVLHKSYGYLQPRVQLDILSYRDLRLIREDNLEATQQFSKDPNRSRVIPILDLKGGLNFIRNINSNWRQTLEPKLYYLYVPRVNQSRYPVFDTKNNDFDYYQLFRDNRYSGVDRLPNANQVTIGVKTSLISSSSSEEKASLGIARARFFQKLTPHLKENLQSYDEWSPTAIYFNYNLTSKWSIEASVVQQKLNKILNNTYRAKYTLSDDKILNLGYHYVRFSKVPQHQSQFSIVWALKAGVSVLSALDYDLSKKRLAYSLFGLELNGCCTTIRLVWAKSLTSTANLDVNKRDNKILAQVVFKGFTDVGNLGNNYMLSKIPGYNPTDRF